MCYITSWAPKRPGAGRFEVENIDPFLCTHVIYAFAGMENYRLAPGHASDMGDGFKEGTYTRLMKLKEKNPNLKVNLARKTVSINGKWSLTRYITRMNACCVSYLHNLLGLK